MSGKKVRPMAELSEMYVLGRDMSAERWTDRLRRDRAFAGLAECLVWQADGRRFMPTRGCAPTPEGPVSLAHPVELDAEEILYWRDCLKSQNIRQPFRQMGEPVVLADGKLPGRVRRVQSAGESYRMLDRYRGFTLPLSAMKELQGEGFRFISRNRFDRRKWRSAEVEVVNIVTPAGILYECAPDHKIDRLAPEDGVGLQLGLFYPFDGVRMRTLNHVAAALEDWLLEQFARGDRPELLLPHLPGMLPGRMTALRALCKAGTETAGWLDGLTAGEGAALC